MKHLLFFIFIVMVLLSCEKDEAVNQATIPKGSYPDQESWEARVTITNEGRVVGEITAGYVQKYSSKKKMYMSDSIEVHFYNRDGVHTSVLNAQGGIIFEKKQDMIAFGNVVVVSDSGVNLYTDTLNWDNQRQKVFSDCPVMIIMDNSDTLYGDSFISDSDLINYEIINPRGKSGRRISIQE